MDILLQEDVRQEVPSVKDLQEFHRNIWPFCTALSSCCWQSIRDKVDKELHFE